MKPKGAGRVVAKYAVNSMRTNFNCKLRTLKEFLFDLFVICIPKSSESVFSLIQLKRKWTRWFEKGKISAILSHLRGNIC